MQGQCCPERAGHVEGVVECTEWTCGDPGRGAFRDYG